MALDTVALPALIVGVTLVVARFLYSYVTSPLKALPGPFVAKFTDLWRFYDYWCCTQIKSHQTLHKKHGPAVRIGPNMVSLSDPELLKQVMPLVHVYEHPLTTVRSTLSVEIMSR